MRDYTFSRRHFSRWLGGGLILALGTGTAAAAQSTPHGWVDVRSAGAKGDGKTDDTKALQAALDAAGEKKGVLFVPPGTYLTSELRVHRNTALLGAPCWDYRHSGGSVLQLIDGKASCLLNLSAAPGVTIEGLSLDGNSLGKEIHGVYRIRDKVEGFREEDSLRIECCRISRFSGNGVRLTHMWASSIRHSMICGSGGDGIYAPGADGFFLDNWISGNGGCGLYLYGSSSTITGNRIEWNNRDGIRMNYQECNITGNYLDRNGTSGIRTLENPAWQNKYISISGNVIFRNGRSADPNTYDASQLRLEAAQGVTCVGNALCVGRDGANDSGIWTPSYGMVYRALENCVIKDNVMHEGATKELMVDLGQHGDEVIIKDNPGRLFKQA